MCIHKYSYRRSQAYTTRNVQETTFGLQQSDPDSGQTKGYHLCFQPQQRSPCLATVSSMDRSLDSSVTDCSCQTSSGYTHNTAECEHLCRSQTGPSPSRSARDAVVTPNPPARRARFDPIDDALRFQGYPGRIHGTSNTLARHEEEQQSPQSSPSANAATLTSQRHPDPANKSAQREEQNDSYCHEPGPAETSNLHDTPQPVPEPSYRRETAPAEPTLRPLDRIQDNLRYYPEYLPAHYETVPRDANPRSEAQGHYYPAYDQHARRIGLEHVRYPEARPGPPAGSSSHYRARTHRYPATNDFPRVYVGDADLRADPRALANSPPSAPGNLMSKFRVVENPARAAQKPSVSGNRRPDGVAGEQRLSACGRGGQ